MNECEVPTCSRTAATDRPVYGKVCAFHAAILDRDGEQDEPEPEPQS